MINQKLVDETAKDIATDVFIQYQETKNKVTYIIVEGEPDQKLWKGALTHKMVNVFNSNGKDIAIKALQLLYDDYLKDFSKKGIIAIVDADFDHIKTEIFNHSSLFRTDFHDIEIMILKSKAFDKFFYSYCTEMDRLKHYLKNKYSKKNIKTDELIDLLKLNILENAKFIGILRWINHIKNLNLFFKTLNYYDFIKKNSLEIDINKLINQIININSKNLEFRKTLTIEFNREFNNFNDKNICQMCQGHDALSILAVGINTFLSKRKRDCRMQSMDVHKFFKVAFELRYLKEFQLYKNLYKWENNNPPFKVLRIEKKEPRKRFLNQLLILLRNFFSKK